MTLRFENETLTCSIIVILLSLLCNHDNLILKSYLEKGSHLGERRVFIGRFKVGSAPRMTKKEALVLFIYKTA